MVTDLRKAFLELLKVDEEFRYTVAGYLGLSEVLKRLEEHDKKFNEVMAILREHDKSLKRLEASLGSLESRLGIDLEKTILNVYSDVCLDLELLVKRLRRYL